MITSDTVHILKLSEKDIASHLIRSKSDFENRTEDFIKEYSAKLSRYALFAISYDKYKNIVGLIAFYANSLPKAFISHVWVSSEARGRGLCGKLIQSVIKFCKLGNYAQIGLEVRTNNESAINAYMKNGFKIVATEGNKYRMTMHLI